MIPSHLQAILAGRVTLRAVAPVAPIPSRAPVFAPSQQGAAPRRSAADVIEECDAPECHECPTMGDNDNPDSFALAMGDE
jgi:hypothetical protein